MLNKAKFQNNQIQIQESRSQENADRRTDRCHVDDNSQIGIGLKNDCFCLPALIGLNLGSANLSIIENVIQHEPSISIQTR